MDKKKKITIASAAAAVVLIIGAIIGIVVSKNNKGNESDPLPQPKVVDNNQRGTENMIGHNDTDGSGKTGPHGATEEKFIGSWSAVDDGTYLVISKNEDGTYNFSIEPPEQIADSNGNIKDNTEKPASGTVNASNTSIEFVVSEGETKYSGTHKYTVKEKGYDYYLVLDSKTEFKYNEQFSSAKRIPGLDSSIEDGRIVPGGEVIEVDPNNPGSEVPGLTPEMLEVPDSEVKADVIENNDETNESEESAE